VMETKSTTANDLNALLRTLRPVPEATGFPNPTIPTEQHHATPSEAPSDPLAHASVGAVDLVAAPARKLGKRSDPAYRLTGIYLPRALADDVKRRLVGSDLDLSDLVTDLLRTWLTPPQQPPGPR
jgi:hypothetical protein